MNSPLRIAIFNDGQLPMPSVKGGSVPTLINMILDENERTHDFDIDVFSCYDKDAIIESKKYKYSKFYFSKSFRIIRFFTNLSFKFRVRFVDLKRIPLPSKFKRLLINNEYDVVYVSGYVRGALTIFKYIRNKRTLRIIAHHTVIDTLHEKSLDGVLLYDNCDLVTFPSEFATKFACTGTQEQNAKNVCHENAIPNLALYQSNIELNRKEIRHKIGFSDDDFIILFVGRMVDYKGIYELIEAINTISKDRSDVKLLICGSSSYSKKIKKTNLGKLLKSIRDNPNVVITGYINYQDIYKYYQAADVTALVTKIPEAFGMVGIESMAAGRPLITTRTGGIRSYSNDENSFVISYNDNMVNDIVNAINFILLNKQCLFVKGQVALRDSKKYTESYYFEQFKEIVRAGLKKYENIMDS